ncbi:MAG TPA: DinB family protein [Mucilaginibacter sp.]|nr:DinB family protein [Mucilaginibacter sp.]
MRQQNNKLEVWLRGSLDDIPVLLQPVAHALLQAREEISDLLADLPQELLWEKPAGLASPAFHLQHISGVLNRLFTYAEGNQLNKDQLLLLQSEGNPSLGDNTKIELFENLSRQIDICLDQLRDTDTNLLTARREVGRAKLPSTMIGLYVHAAEHTMRHTGQLLVTIRILTENINDDTDATLIT